jgi:hypothetical protein
MRSVLYYTWLALAISKLIEKQKQLRITNIIIDLQTFLRIAFSKKFPVSPKRRFVDFYRVRSGLTA